MEGIRALFSLVNREIHTDLDHKDGIYLVLVPGSRATSEVQELI